MTGVWMLLAAFALLPAAWFLIARPLACRWGGCWWGKEHGKKARAMRSAEKPAHIWPFGTGWALLTRIGAGAGVLWLLWPAAAQAQAGGWGALCWLLAVWMVLGAVRDYAILHAAAHSGQTAPAGIMPLLGGETIWRLLLLLGWAFCVLLLAVLGSLMAAFRPAWVAAGDLAAGWDAAGSAVTAGFLLTAGALALGVMLQYAALHRAVRAALSLGILALCLAAGLVCPVPLKAGPLCILLFLSVFCAAAAPPWLLTRPRGALCGWLLLFCLAAGIFTVGVGAASAPAAAPAVSSPLPAPAAPGGLETLFALLFAAGGGTAAGLQAVASGCAAARMLRPAQESDPAIARRERAICVTGFGGGLLPGLLAAAALAVLCGLPAFSGGGAEGGNALSALLYGGGGYAGLLAGCLAPLGPAAGGVGVLVWVMVALAGLCALDAAAAAGRSALQTVFGSASLPPNKLAPWRKLLRSAPVASLLTVLPALFLAGLGADALLPILDGLGWLVSGLALLAAILSHRRAGRKSGMLWPLAAALLAAGWLSLARAARQAVCAGGWAWAAAAALFALIGLMVALQGLRRAAQQAAGAKAAKEGKRIHRANNTE